MARVRFPVQHANMLSDLIAPDDTNCAAEAFKERFLEWDNPVQRYGVPSGETLDDSLMVAVIVMSRHSPPELRAALRSHIKTKGRDCQKLRTFVNDFLTSGLEYTSAAVLSGTSVGGEQETKEAPRLEPKVFERSS